MHTRPQDAAQAAAAEEEATDNIAAAAAAAEPRVAISEANPRMRYLEGLTEALGPAHESPGGGESTVRAWLCQAATTPGRGARPDAVPGLVCQDLSGRGVQDGEDADSFHDAASELGEGVDEAEVLPPSLPGRLQIWAADCESHSEASFENWMQFGVDSNPELVLAQVVGCFIPDAGRLCQGKGQTGEPRSAECTHVAVQIDHPSQARRSEACDVAAIPAHLISEHSCDNVVISPIFSPLARFQTVRTKWVDETEEEEQGTADGARQHAHTPCSEAHSALSTTCEASTTPSETAAKGCRIDRFGIVPQSPSDVATNLFRMNRFSDSYSEAPEQDESESYDGQVVDQLVVCDEQVSNATTCCDGAEAPPQAPLARSQSDGTSASEYQSVDDFEAFEEQCHQGENKLVTPEDWEKRSQDVAPSRPDKPRDYEDEAKSELEALMDFGNTQRSLRHEKRRALKTPPGIAPACRRSLFFQSPRPFG